MQANIWSHMTETDLNFTMQSFLYWTRIPLDIGIQHLKILIRKSSIYMGQFTLHISTEFYPHDYLRFPGFKETKEAMFR